MSIRYVQEFTSLWEYRYIRDWSIMINLGWIKWRIIDYRGDYCTFKGFRNYTSSEVMCKISNSLFAKWGLNWVIKVNGRGLVAEDLREALRNSIMVIIEGEIEKLEKEYLICIAVGSDLQGESLDSILDILLLKNWSNTLGRSSIFVSGNTWIGTRPRRLLASLYIALLLSRF